MRIFWDDLDRGDWTARLDLGRSAALQQSWDYGQAARALGAGVRRARVADGQGEIALAQVLDRCGLRLINRGPVWLRAVDPAQKRRVLRALVRGPTLATPEDAVAGFGLVPLLTGRFHAIWSLDPSPEVLRAGLERRWAGRLAAAERAGVQAATGHGKVLDLLIREEAAQRRRIGYRGLPPDFPRHLPSRALRLWHWKKDGGTAAAMAFVRHGDAATYQTGWAGPAARRCGVHQAMLWEAALALRAEGVRRIDLGTVDTESAPGLAHFKLGTGADLRRLGPTAWVLPALRWCGHERQSPED
ncbi:MAG: GNAT family N-acetyltransferase [Rhodobacter sp.]|nr:GNAT family N-acetyltransferase [Rhodobacter sp.]MCA3511931.1 GNAT family N-acetyltransferase [Rhodobacter sp.]MCA3519005.1 GNAT family N-acetyltransferase [Rhodobacter sp.]MCA3522326.1 GNAT family N-acetyltransferase [Rhodobacter sp.]MCA3526487.1 GNAT family N-acetyltransferase [Rhodobacter sp.]